MKTDTSKAETHADPFEVFYDGLCPICVREIEMLRRKDRDHRIRFTDFASEEIVDLDKEYDYDRLMSRIHGRFPNGEVIHGPEVFRQLYSRIGFRKLVFLSRIPPLSWMIAIAYLVFAKLRLRMTGRHCTTGCSVSSGSRFEAVSRASDSARKMVEEKV